MASSADRRRRWVGIVCLVLAGGLLLAGQTILAPRLEGIGFLIYWLCCFVLTVAALVVAFLDIRALRRRIRNEQRQLLRQTLEDLSKPDAGEPEDHAT